MIKKTTPQQAAKVNFDIDGRIMHSSEKTKAILLTLQPGEKIPSHTNPFDVLFIGIQGQVSITAGNQVFTLAALRKLLQIVVFFLMPFTYAPSVNYANVIFFVQI